MGLDAMLVDVIAAREFIFLALQRGHNANFAAIDGKWYRARGFGRLQRGEHPDRAAAKNLQRADAARLRTRTALS
jgi:hypothetical protein